MTAQHRYPRVGIGYDVHRFAPGRRMVLGGVEIAFDRGLEGHSDADVLLHAIADAILGAAALGDIGTHFPPGGQEWRDADSRDLLRRTITMVRENGWQVSNIDATVVAEAPRVTPHVGAMKEAISSCVGIPANAIGLKATTNEGLGFVGRQEGIAAIATAMIVPIESIEVRDRPS